MVCSTYHLLYCLACLALRATGGAQNRTQLKRWPQSHKLHSFCASSSEVGPYFIRKYCANCVAAELTKRPVEGFSAGLVDDSNIYEWEIVIVGPPDTPYEGMKLCIIISHTNTGGLFKAILTFTSEYPNK